MITIRNAGPDDAARLAALAERTFRDTFAGDNTPADMDAHVAGSYSPDLQRRELEDPRVVTIVGAAAGGELVAYAQVRDRPAPEAVTGPAPVELGRFYVLHAYHGAGIAQPLMQAVCDEATARGFQTLWLGVWERNPRAQAFYRRCGFVDVGTQAFVLGADLQTDRLMSRPLVAGGGPPASPDGRGRLGDAR